MPQPRIYRFKIDAYTPATLPLARLAEYITDLAKLFGEQPNVHLIAIEESSTVLVTHIDQEAAPKIFDRIVRVRRGEGDPEATAAVRNINNKLREDNGKGSIAEERGAEILEFPGRDLEQPTIISAFSQDGNIDGIVIAVGGKRDPVPVHLDGGQTIYKCQARRAIAKRLGNHLFTDEVRVKGNGRWSIDDSGNWILERFTIHDYEVLDRTPLTEVVASLRAITGTNWDTIADPWADLTNLRRGSDES